MVSERGPRYRTQAGDDTIRDCSVARNCPPEGHRQVTVRLAAIVPRVQVFPPAVHNHTAAVTQPHRAAMLCGTVGVASRALRVGMARVQGYSAVARAMTTVTQESAIRKAEALTTGMDEVDWSLQEKMALAARILAKQGHGNTLSGQITARADDQHTGQLFMWTQRYGTPLELIVPGDFVKIDENLDVVDGEGFPNLATRFHLHVYRNRPDMKCAVHTHAPWTSALAMTGFPLHIGHMDTMVGHGAHLQGHTFVLSHTQPHSHTATLTHSRLCTCACAGAVW